MTDEKAFDDNNLLCWLQYNGVILYTMIDLVATVAIMTSVMQTL